MIRHTRYDQSIVNASKEFAKTNSIPFSNATSIMISNAVRTVRMDEKKKIDELLKYATEIRNNAKKMYTASKEKADKNYWEGEFIVAEAMIFKIKEVAGITKRNKAI